MESVPVSGSLDLKCRPLFTQKFVRPADGSWLMGVPKCSPDEEVCERCDQLFSGNNFVGNSNVTLS